MNQARDGQKHGLCGLAVLLALLLAGASMTAA